MQGKEDYVSKTIKTYDLVAAEYSVRTKHQIQLEYINKFFSVLPKNAPVLDAGCAPGRDALYLQENGLNVTGIDLSRNLLEIARKESPKSKFIEMDIRKLD